ncbi:conserved hypothetical protein [Culex quinquefasciatus]|uniref:Uncharacterized protein n=1 Tax=Culex quinquefasciatus TaxID=7176 RepID=B0X418_CULQU|nr:conserved hypothetical protein [Culex quinquefasciatus]|eukprot:XP_001864390.1 conserved hypothetical protein [Culex quinquefasciatus]
MLVTIQNHVAVDLIACTGTQAATISQARLRELYLYQLAAKLNEHLRRVKDRSAAAAAAVTSSLMVIEYVKRTEVGQSVQAPRGTSPFAKCDRPHGKNKNVKTGHIYESISNLRCCNLQAAAKTPSHDDCAEQLCHLALQAGTLREGRYASTGGDVGHSNLGCGSRNGSGSQSSELEATKLVEDKLRISAGHGCAACQLVTRTDRGQGVVLQEQPLENSPKHRHRSHTISACVSVDQQQQCTTIGADQKLVVVVHDETITSAVTSPICTRRSMRRKLRQSMRPFMVKLSSMVESTVLPVATLTPSRILQHHVAHAKANKKEQRLAVTNRAHGHQGKLSTAVLNQQYPNLSAGGRAGRTNSQTRHRIRCRSPNGNPQNQKVFNKECLISSATKKNIRTHHTTRPKRFQPRPHSVEGYIGKKIGLLNDLEDMRLVKKKAVSN